MSQQNLARLSRALTGLGAKIRTAAVPEGLPFSHDATSLAAAEARNLICADGEFGISFRRQYGRIDIHVSTDELASAGTRLRARWRHHEVRWARIAIASPENGPIGELR